MSLFYFYAISMLLRTVHGIELNTLFILNSCPCNCLQGNNTTTTNCNRSYRTSSLPKVEVEEESKCDCEAKIRHQRVPRTSAIGQRSHHDHPYSVLHMWQGYRKQMGGILGTSAGRVHRGVSRLFLPREIIRA